MIQEFIKARARLVLDNPFFGTLCLRLKPVETDDIETGATDGVSLLYNPKWFKSLSESERIGFLAHEVMHVVCMHHTRRQERDPEKWNVAGDYVINRILLANDFILPKGGLISDEYDDMTTEYVYNLLPDPPESFAIMLKKNGCGDVLDHPNMGKTESIGAIEAKLTVAVNQAAESARSQGKLPGSMETILKDINEPKVDWRMVLARFLRSNNKSDYSWVRPNRRFIWQGLYLPSAYNPCLDEIAIVSDTSGSRTDEELNQDLAEISTILMDLSPNKIHFIQCDTEVQDHTEYTRESLPLEITCKGRGGTRFSPAIEYVNETTPNVSALVYLTDLEATDFGEQPSYPVLWITTHEEEAPYGEIIKI